MPSRPFELYQEVFMGGRPDPFAAGGVPLAKLKQEADGHAAEVPNQAEVNAIVDDVISNNRQSFFFNMEPVIGGIPFSRLIDLGQSSDATVQTHIESLHTICKWSTTRRRTQNYTYMPQVGMYTSSLRQDDTLSNSVVLTEEQIATKQTEVDRWWKDASGSLTSFMNHLDMWCPSSYDFYTRRTGVSEQEEIDLYVLAQSYLLPLLSSARSRLQNNGNSGNTKIIPFISPAGHPGGSWLNRTWPKARWRASLDCMWDNYQAGHIDGICVWMSDTSQTPRNYTAYTVGTTNVATWAAVTDAKIKGDVSSALKDTAQFSFAAAVTMDDVASILQNALNAKLISDGWPSPGPWTVTYDSGSTELRTSASKEDYDFPLATTATLSAPSAGGTDISVAGFVNVASEAADLGSLVTLNFTDLFVTTTGSWWDAMNEFVADHAGDIVSGGSV